MEVALQIIHPAQEYLRERAGDELEASVHHGVYSRSGQLLSQAGHGNKSGRLPAPMLQATRRRISGRSHLQHIGKDPQLRKQEFGSQEAVAERRSTRPDRAQG